MSTPNPNHPQAIAARMRKEARERQRELIRSHKENDGLRFLHTGSYTICYRVDRKSVVELSCTIQHPNDKLDRVLGEFEALKKFSEKQRIVIKVPRPRQIKNYLQAMFGHTEQRFKNEAQYPQIPGPSYNAWLRKTIRKEVAAQTKTE